VPRPVTVAITGGIAAGKSTALEAFRRHGAATISSDEIVHRIYEDDADVREAVRERWGDGVLAADGSVERAAIARQVFGHPEELAWLEALLHPRVQREYQAWRTQLEQSPSPPPAIVTEIPLLYETGGETRFDKVVVITAPAPVREQRRGPTADRESRLLPDEEKVRRADYAYENTGSPEELDRFVARVMEDLSRFSDG
jgi:dephospho-CoA kinase